ncbi:MULTISPECIES: HINT domain-containing protein [Streptomyces]|uniref:HINT domain-containing protein n=1 Tax=Streptomyces bacillaris TaxID=68179 RepID=A0ABW6DV68_9ACTN|nr:HINT domain-containing protein [Streptomyces nanshensis]
MKSGQWLQTSTGGRLKVTAIERWTQKVTVYNLTVSNLHTYYVLAGATPVLVHNAGGNGPEVPGIIQQRIAEILAGQAQPRLNGDRTGPDRFEVRTGRNNPTPGAHARKWGPSSPGANDAALIYDMGDGENRYRILVNRHGDVGWVDNHNYRKIRVYTPGC